MNPIKLFRETNIQKPSIMEDKIQKTGKHYSQKDLRKSIDKTNIENEESSEVARNSTPQNRNAWHFVLRYRK